LSAEDNAKINDIVACSELNGWEPCLNLFGPATTKKFSLFREGSPIKLIKGISPVQTTADEIFKFFCEPAQWMESMKVADIMFMGGRVLSVHDAHHTTCHAKFRTPPGINNRDFCYRTLSTMPDEHTAIAIAWSVEDDECPPDSTWGGAVRGEILASGYIARDIPGTESCELTYIVQVDPKGWVPVAITNLVAADQADNVTRVAKYFAKIRGGLPVPSKDAKRLS